MAFQIGAGAAGEAFPVVFGGYADITVTRGLALFKRHFQENQIGNLLQIIAVAYAIVAQHMAKAPYFLHNGVGCWVVWCGHHQFLLNVANNF